jgi:thiamine-monophosphate kinase
MPRRKEPANFAEDALIARIGKRLSIGARAAPALRLGIGDDAAILRASATEDWIFSTDFSLENVHFRLDTHPPDAIGYRALARAASDLAAMGCEPAFFLLSLAVPRECTGKWLDAMLGGMHRAARRLSLHLIGGDTTCLSQVAIAITVIGRAVPGRVIRRDGARPGDLVCVSGRLGAAALGLAFLLQKRRSATRRGAIAQRGNSLLQPHLYPQIPIALGLHLARQRLASAMMDISDGLSTDLARLAKASGVKARIHLDRLPAVRVPPALARRGIRAETLALHGGEDYGLLFTVPASHANRIPRAFRGVPITVIGEILQGRGLEAVEANGRIRPLPSAGWDPFRKRTAIHRAHSSRPIPALGTN